MRRLRVTGLRVDSTRLRVMRARLPVARLRVEGVRLRVDTRLRVPTPSYRSYIRGARSLANRSSVNYTLGLLEGLCSRAFLAGTATALYRPQSSVTR